MAPKNSKKVKLALRTPPLKPLTFTDLVMRAARVQNCETKHKRTPVKTRIRRIETGIKTPDRKSKELKRLKRGNTDLPPGQKKIEAFFIKKTMVGRTGLSREAKNTNQKIQGAETSPLESVQNTGASNQTSGGSKPLPVERGGGVRY